MRLELKLLTILCTTIFLASFLIDYLIIHTAIPYLLLNLIFIPPICWVFIEFLKKSLISKINQLPNKHALKNLDDIYHTINLLSQEYSDFSKNLSNTLNNISDVYIELNLNFEIIRANHLAKKYLGLNIIGEPISKCIKQLSPVTLIKGLMSNQSYKSTIVLDNISYLLVISPNIFIGKVKGYTVILTANGENKQILKKFNSDIDHQIKTSITALLNASETLIEDKSLNKDLLKEFLPILYKQSKKLAQLVKNIDNH